MGLFTLGLNLVRRLIEFFPTALDWLSVFQGGIFGELLLMFILFWMVDVGEKIGTKAVKAFAWFMEKFKR